MIGLHRALFTDASPATTKFALAHLGLCLEDARLPVVLASEASRQAVLAALREAASSDGGQADRREPAARFDYFLEDFVEAGLALTGTEVKSLRNGRANIAEAADVQGREIMLINADIPPYTQANRFNHEPRRHRKLLLHRKQIDKMIAAVQGRPHPDPGEALLNDKGVAKLEIALAKGKKLHDKREASADRDWARDKARLMRDKG